MNTRAKALEGTEVRMMSIAELMSYTGMGRNSAENFARQAGAKKKYGKRALYDRRLIDKALSELEPV